MRPFFGPFTDDPDRPPPDIVEKTNVAHPTFGFKLKDRFKLAHDLAADDFLTKRAREAYLWLKNNATGLFRVDPEQKTIGNYVNVQILNERDVVLFKTYWL
jgi:hypothetical protein